MRGTSCRRDHTRSKLSIGLIEEHELPETCAERELLEETGYIGKACYTSCLKYNGKRLLAKFTDTDAGFSNCNMKTVICQVDLKDTRNQNPSPKLEPSEFIETFKVPLTHLASELEKLEREGYALTARLASFAMGIEIAKRYHLVA